ncbi:leucine-rich repeat protein [Ruminococcus sp.]|uniref:leucine-rich repeat protein n=1 Tax=Ruminococcus sp. TaxID=41978 RepID=UPI00351FEE2A
MKCPNCGNEITGKFCTSCGTPAPVEEPAPQPYQYNSSANQPNDMPVNNGYTGQQFTNVPNNMTNQPKKGMSDGKVAAIVISVILGIIIILAVVFGIVACNVFKTVDSLIDAVKEGVSIGVKEGESIGVKEGVSIFVEDNESKYNSDSSAESSERNYDSASHFYYQEINDGSEIEITGYNYMDTFDETFTDKNFEIRVPNEINGKPVTSVCEIYVYNYSNIDTDDLNMKLIIPGSVKNIEGYALWGLEGVTEIVFEDGVESIGDYAVYNCKYLKKITIPESVTYIDDVGVGYLDSNEENVISKDLVIVAKKGSTAEKYAQDNGFKVENN